MFSSIAYRVDRLLGYIKLDDESELDSEDSSKGGERIRFLGNTVFLDPG